MDDSAGCSPGADRVRRIGRDLAAPEAFYIELYPDVVWYFSRRVHDPHDVVDLVADTFVSALGAAATFDLRRGRPLGWLFALRASPAQVAESAPRTRGG